MSPVSGVPRPPAGGLQEGQAGVPAPQGRESGAPRNPEEPSAPHGPRLQTPVVFGE